MRSKSNYVVQPVQPEALSASNNNYSPKEKHLNSIPLNKILKLKAVNQAKVQRRKLFMKLVDSAML